MGEGPKRRGSKGMLAKGSGMLRVAIWMRWDVIDDDAMLILMMALCCLENEIS